MASKAVGLLTFNFGANLGGFDRAMKKAQKKLKKFGKSVERTGKNLTTNLTLPIVALGAVSVKAFNEQAVAEQKLLVALNGQVEVQSRLIQQAKELQKSTLFGDEQTIAAQSMLAMMGLTEDEIVKLIPLIQDFAAAKGMDLVTASDLVAKSMGSSTNALSRYGIEITGAVGSSERLDTAVSQLTDKFGGQAEAMSLVGAGPLIQMKNQLGDLAEQLGERLMPFVIQFVGWMTKMIDKFDSLSSTQKDNIVKWGLVLAAIGPVLLIVGKAIVAYTSLRVAFATLQGFLIANPWVLLATAIGLVVAAIYRQVSATTALEDAQASANKSVASDMVKIEQLTGIIKDKTATDEEQIKALNKLKELYPGFYDEIDETTKSTAALDTATNNLLVSLKATALSIAIQNQMVTTQEEILETQKKLDNADPKWWLLQKDTRAGMTEHLKNLNKDLDELTDKANELRKSGEIIPTNVVSPPTHDGNDGNDDGDNGPSNRKVKSIEAITHATKELKLELKDYNMELATAIPLEEVFDIEPVNKYREVFGFFGGEIADFFGTTLPELESGLESMVNKLGDNLAQGAESFEEFGKSVLGVLRDVIGGLISQGIAAAIANALKDSFLPVWAIPVVAGAAAGLARTAFNSLIPQFAEGGLVTGPTLGLIGEGPGTNAGNPEVIAPLDKLKSMIGGGNQNIVVEGKLAGNDIFLSNARTKFNRNRTV